MDDLKLYEFKYYTYKLSKEIPDELIQNLFHSNPFETNILEVISQTNINYQANEDDLKEWIDYFIDLIVKNSQYEYSDIDIKIYKEYVYYFIIGPRLTIESPYLHQYIHSILDILNYPTQPFTGAEYCKENLRLILLKICNFNQELFSQYIDIVWENIQIAKKESENHSKYKAMLNSL